MTLRPYQQTTLDALYDWLRSNSGDPCIVAPTGSGKSVIIASFVESAIKNYPETRVVVISHVKELVAQDFRQLLQIWPNAPAGVYSAGLKSREVSRITFAGIQSVRKKPEILGHINLCIVDEAHTISHKDEGGYRELIKSLREINPGMRVIGLTATPWRLGHGRIDEGEALFDDLIEPVSIRELVYGGYLAPLVSRATHERYTTDGIKKRGGEYIEKELQERVDTADQNAAVAREIVEIAGDRRAWLLFCTGVDHAYHMRDQLRELGITAETITGKTPDGERDDLLVRYKAGEIRAITNANVLTTGFDYPDIDLIALLRPTMSPGLYMQMVGRGFRIKSHTDHCLVLDFAGVIAQHGPITAVEPPSKAGEGDGIPPGKECPECHWIVPASVKNCINPDCLYEFPEPEPESMMLRNDDIMGDEPPEIEVWSWRWEEKESKAGNPMIVVSYYGDIGSQPLREYLLIWAENFAGQKGRQALNEICNGAGIDWTRYRDIADFMEDIRNADPPRKVIWTRDGKYKRVIGREWASV
ncbi:MAG: DEAD/DEAH box helicase family protein [Advenella sp.]